MLYVGRDEGLSLSLSFLIWEVSVELRNEKTGVVAVSDDVEDGRDGGRGDAKRKRRLARPFDRYLYEGPFLNCHLGSSPF